MEQCRPRKSFVTEMHGPSGAKRGAVPKKRPLTAEAQAMISRFQADYIDLLRPDRARRAAAIKRAGASNYQIAAGAKFSETTVRNLLLTLKAPAEDQLLARSNSITTRELVRRSKAATLKKQVQHQKAFERQRNEAARKGAVDICNWFLDIGFTGPTCEQIIDEVRREFGYREQDGNLPAHPLQELPPLQTIIERSRPVGPVPNDPSVVSWYALWLYRWTFFAFPDSVVRDEALDIALQKQWKR